MFVDGDGGESPVDPVASPASTPVDGTSGQQFEATLEGAPSGLVGTVALTVDDMDGAAVIARSTSGIVELSDGTDPGVGVYVATRTAPTVTTATNFTLIWDLGDPDDPATTYTETLLVGPAAALPQLPSTNDVASILRARTRDNNTGAQLGQFTDATSVTDPQVQHMIQAAAADVAIRTGVEVEEATTLDAAVRQAIVYRTGMLIELGWPEQSGEDVTAYARLEAMYEQAIDGIQDSSDVARPETQVVSVPILGDGAFDPTTGLPYEGFWL